MPRELEDCSRLKMMEVGLKPQSGMLPLNHCSTLLIIRILDKM